MMCLENGPASRFAIKQTSVGQAIIREGHLTLIWVYVLSELEK